MGILCENCENKNNDDSDSQKSNSKTSSKQEIFALPKQYVSEKIQEEKKLNMEIFNKKKEEDENNKKAFNKKSYSKAKTILNPNSCKDIKNKAYLSKLSKIVERSNSLNISEEKKTTIINKEMDNLENRLSLKFKKRRFSKSEMVTEKPQQKMKIFTRRKKKSTTLMENNQVINNLRKIQMSVPL